MNIKEAIDILAKEYEIPLESGLFSKNKQKLRYMLIYILNVDLRLKYDEIKQYLNKLAIYGGNNVFIFSGK